MTHFDAKFGVTVQFALEKLFGLCDCVMFMKIVHGVGSDKGLLLKKHNKSGLLM